MIEILSNSLSKFFDLLKLLYYYLHFAPVIFWMNEYEFENHDLWLWKWLCNIEKNMNYVVAKVYH